jgi:hypothetical protein
MTHTPATRGALVDRLLGLHNLLAENTGALVDDVIGRDELTVLREAAAALASPQEGWLSQFTLRVSDTMPKDAILLMGSAAWDAINRGERPHADSYAFVRLPPSPTPPASDTAALEADR